MDQDTKIAAADIAPGKHYCHDCKRVTVWSGTRWGDGKPHVNNQHCRDCGAHFPCRSKRCGHSDCDAARATRTVTKPDALLERYEHEGTTAAAELFK